MVKLEEKYKLENQRYIQYQLPIKELTYPLLMLRNKRNQLNRKKIIQLILVPLMSLRGKMSQKMKFLLIIVIIKTSKKGKVNLERITKVSLKILRNLLKRRSTIKYKEKVQNRQQSRKNIRKFKKT